MSDPTTTRCPALHERGNDRRLWQAMTDAAQCSYVAKANPGYGLSDADMEAAVRAALTEMEARNGKR